MEALKAILSEWSSGRSYEARTENLKGTGTGPRLNAGYFLQAEGGDATVIDDDAKDELHGGLGRDWFFASFSGSKKDKIHGVTFGEWIENLASASGPGPAV